jgi:hypothetical protein
MNRWRLILAVLAGLALTACDDATGIVEVDRVDVGPSDLVVVVGDSAELTAVPRAANGAVVEGPIEWRSLDPSIATVRAAGGKGIVVAKAAGTARIEAESRGTATQVFVEVEEPAQVGSVDVLPGTIVLEVGHTISVQAEVKSTTGEILTGRAIAWSVEPAGAVTIATQANGWLTITAQAPGEAMIRAEVEGAAGQAWVQVAAATPPPQPVASVEIIPGNFSLPVNHETSLQAVAKRADGQVIYGRPVTWSVSASAIAEVTGIPNSSFGGFRAKSAGTVTVRATIDGVVGEITVQVTQTSPPQQVYYLFFNASRRGIWTGNIVWFENEITAIGPNGTIENPEITWSVEDETILALDESNGVKGLRAGTTRVIARSGQAEARVLVTVFQPQPSPVWDLTYDWWDGQWHMAPQVGTEKWTDGNGVEHDVALYATSGTLQVQNNGDYERRLQLTGWVHLEGGAQKVIEREEVDVGLASIMVGGETGWWMHSDTKPGHVYKVVAAFNAGHLLMTAPIGTAPDHAYMWRMRQ